MSWFLFDERGQRARQLTLLSSGPMVVPGWCAHKFEDFNPTHVIGFDPERTWRPTYFVAKMARGYRVFGLDGVPLEYVEAATLVRWWRAGEGKRLPTMAAVEMYLRHTCG